MSTWGLLQSVCLLTPLLGRGAAAAGCCGVVRRGGGV